MSRSHISKAIRERVAANALHRCGYCLTSESIVGYLMDIDHLVPEVLGGLTEEENLWLACSVCNSYKGDRIVALDVTGEMARIFNPRLQTWAEHFRWTEGGDQVGGITPCGRVTVSMLNLNRPALVIARRAWVSVGWHPPKG